MDVSQEGQCSRAMVSSERQTGHLVGAAYMSKPPLQIQAYNSSIAARTWYSWIKYLFTTDIINRIFILSILNWNIWISPLELSIIFDFIVNNSHVDMEFLWSALCTLSLEKAFTRIYLLKTFQVWSVTAGRSFG